LSIAKPFLRLTTKPYKTYFACGVSAYLLAYTSLKLAFNATEFLIFLINCLPTLNNEDITQTHLA
jgi:hypothetical protein